MQGFENSNDGTYRVLMEPPSIYTRAGDHPVIYAGRFVERVNNVDLSECYEVLGKGAPSRIAAVIDAATSLIVLDPISFPFDALSKRQWDVPIIVALPSG